MNKSNKKRNKPGVLYLVIIFAYTFGLGILEKIFQTGQFYNFLQKSFTAVPVVTGLIVQKITGEKSKFKLSLKVWKNHKMWIFSAFVPAVLITLGAVLYFSIFSNEYSGVFALGQLIGSDASMEISNPI